MKKKVDQILLILVVVMVSLLFILIPNVYAESVAGLNVSSATVGGTFSVSLILPSEAIGAQCTVTVTYSDGTTSTQNLVYMQGMSENIVTFSAKVAGTTVINATGIKISDSNANTIESGGSKSQTITINNVSVPTPPENNNNSGSDSNGAGNNSNNNSDKDNHTTPKEPEIVNPTFQDVNETVYATQGCNVRSSCSSDISSNKIGGLVAGQEVKRTGIADGWSRISYNGQTAYVASRLLTTEKPEEPEELENIVEENTTNTLADNVVAEENAIVNETNLVEDQLNSIQAEIGVLPEVGNNIATNIFYGVTLLGLGCILIINYIIRSKNME